MTTIIKHEYQHRTPFAKRARTTALIVHCSATPEGKDYTVQDIDRWHKERHFDCIGYHYVVYRDGSIHQGRPDWSVGAHCQGKNSTSVGVCYIGGCDSSMRAKDTRTDAQKTALRTILNLLAQKYKGVKVYGHRNFAKKACPSFDAYNEYKDIQ